MPRPIRFTFTMVAADDNGVCLSQTPSGGGAQNLTINGALASGGVATMDVARHVSITSTLDDSGRTFTVTGTDRFGNSISESITGPNGTTVNGTKNFKTITAITVDNDTTGAITVGSSDEAETQWLPLCHYKTPFSVGLSAEITSGASLNYGAQFTMDDVQADGFQESDAQAFNHATMTGETANQSDVQSTPVSAMRFAITSYVSGSVSFGLIQAG